MFPWGAWGAVGCRWSTIRCVFNLKSLWGLEHKSRFLHLWGFARCFDVFCDCRKSTNWSNQIHQNLEKREVTPQDPKTPVVTVFSSVLKPNQHCAVNTAHLVGHLYAALMKETWISRRDESYFWNPQLKYVRFWKILSCLSSHLIH